MKKTDDGKMLIEFSIAPNPHPSRSLMIEKNSILE
jgi:hypothetical protein